MWECSLSLWKSNMHILDKELVRYSPKEKRLCFDAILYIFYICVQKVWKKWADNKQHSKTLKTKADKDVHWGPTTVIQLVLMPSAFILPITSWVLCQSFTM